MPCGEMPWKCIIMGKICLGVLPVFMSSLLIIGCGGGTSDDEEDEGGGGLVVHRDAGHSAADSGITEYDAGIIERDSGIIENTDAAVTDDDAGIIEDSGILDDASSGEEDSGIIDDDAGLTNDAGPTDDAGETECAEGLHDDGTGECTLQFISIPAGPFTLSHETGIYRSGVTISMNAFLLKKTPVTVAEFEKCVAAGACTSEHYRTAADVDAAYCNYNRGNAWKNHPMNCINMSGAREYCEWIGGRLPTRGVMGICRGASWNGIFEYALSLGTMRRSIA